MRVSDLCFRLSWLLPVILVGLLCATLVAAERPMAGAVGLHHRRHAALSDSTAKDTVPLAKPIPDSAFRDSIPADSTGSMRQDSVYDDEFELEDIVEYEATDSIVLLGQNRAYLFGKSYVSYQKSRLEANFMYLNTDSSTVYTRYVLDTAGYPMAFPVFKDGEQSFEAKNFTYNFRTEKGIISGVITQQGEGYLTAGKTKKMPDNIMFMQGGRYTTCDNHDHPHFYINLSKAKVHPEKDIVTGPVNLVIADMPLPIGLPFGYFPFSNKYSSGILMPTYGEDNRYGFYLRNGGYYFAFSDYIDLALRGEIFSKGSWGISAQSKYKKRYKYNGSFEANYLVSKSGDKYVPGDYSETTSLNIRWTHSQDPKANPLQTLSANVNFATGSYFQNSLNTTYDVNARTATTRSSAVSYSRKFPGTPFSITGSMDISQNMRDTTVSLTLPNLSINMSTRYPFKRKTRVGPERWYEKLSVGYSGQLRNSILTKEKDLLQSNLVRDWKNGMRHSVPISLTVPLLDYINLTMGVNYNEWWYTKGIRKSWNEDKKTFLPSDTTYKFRRLYDYSLSAGLSTTLYGMFKPWKPFSFGGNLIMIRHRFTPTVSFSYMPDFTKRRYGFWEHLEHTDQNGKLHTLLYSPYSEQIFGAPSMGNAGSVNFSFDNNLEAKIKSKSDSTGIKKISLIDQFTWSTSYNMFADSIRWSNISASLALRLSKSFTLRLSGLFDPYLTKYYEGEDGKIIPYKSNDLRIFNGKGLARLISTGTSFSYTLNKESLSGLIALFSGKKERRDEKKNTGATPLEGDDAADILEGGRPQNESGGSLLERNRQGGAVDQDGYFAYSIPWSLSFDYSWNIATDYNRYNVNKMEHYYRVTQNLSFRGNIQPTPNWSFGFNANYNFDLKKITSLTCNVTRDMHCWAISASFIPIGAYKSYNFVISVKSSLLQDLKYQQSNRPITNTWY